MEGALLACDKVWASELIGKPTITGAVPLLDTMVCWECLLGGTVSDDTV